MTQEQLKTDLNIFEEIRIKDRYSYTFLANKKLISLSYNGEISIRNIISGELEFKKKTSHRYIYVINKYVCGLTKKLLSIYEYKNRLLTKKKSVKVIENDVSKIDGNKLAFINSTSGEIYDFTTSTVRQLKLNFTTTDGQKNKIVAVTLTPKHILCSCQNQIIYIYNFNGDLINNIHNINYDAKSLWNYKDYIIAHVHDYWNRPSIQIWDIKLGSLITTLCLNEDIHAVTVTDEILIVKTFNKLKSFNLNTLNLIKEINHDNPLKRIMYKKPYLIGIDYASTVIIYKNLI